MQKVMRPSKHGGISPCGSPPDKVGKGRCHHILEEGDNIVIDYNSQDKSYYLDLSDKIGNDKAQVKINNEIVVKFMSNISKSINKEDKEKILNFMRESN